MKEVTFYECDRCQRAWRDPEEAAECEASDPPRPPLEVGKVYRSTQLPCFMRLRSLAIQNLPDRPGHEWRAVFADPMAFGADFALWLYPRPDGTWPFAEVDVVAVEAMSKGAEA